MNLRVIARFYSAESFRSEDRFCTIIQDGTITGLYTRVTFRYLAWIRFNDFLTQHQKTAIKRVDDWTTCVIIFVFTRSIIHRESKKYEMKNLIEVVLKLYIFRKNYDILCYDQWLSQFIVALLVCNMIM